MLGVVFPLCNNLIIHQREAVYQLGAKTVHINFHTINKLAFVAQHSRSDHLISEWPMRHQLTQLVYMSHATHSFVRRAGKLTPDGGMSQTKALFWSKRTSNPTSLNERYGLLSDCIGQFGLPSPQEISWTLQPRVLKNGVRWRGNME